jgi:transcriptional regulator with XRE-family HTH domain
MKLNDFDQKLKENPEYVEAMGDLKLHFDLAKAVLRARLQKGWSQTELARAVGTRQANISKIEAGLGNPTLALIRKLTKALELEVQFGGSAPPPVRVGYTTSITRESANTAIQVGNWPVYSPKPEYRLISDASTESEGYHV